MTKLEICAIEDANPGQVYLYPEGAFYKAYQKIAWILCTKLHPLKLSSRSLKGLERPLLSVGFPQSSLDKFSAGLMLSNLAFVKFTWHLPSLIIKQLALEKGPGEPNLVPPGTGICPGVLSGGVRVARWTQIDAIAQADVP